MIQSLAQGVAGTDVGAHRHRPQLVEVVELARRHRLAHLDQVGQLHHAVVAPAHVDAVEILRVAAIDALQLHHHVVLLATLLETSHLAAAEQAFQAAADGRHVAADRHRLFAVDRHLELRRVQLEVAVQAFQPRIVTQAVQQLIDVGLQLGIFHRGADHEVDRLIACTLPQRRPVDRKGPHPGDLLELGQQLVADLELAAAAVAPVLQLHEGNALGHGGETGDHHVAIGLRDARVGRLDLPRIAPGVTDGGAVRAVEHADDGAGVLGRRQLGLQAGEQQQAGQQGQQQHPQHQPPGHQGAGQQALVAMGQAVEEILDQVVQAVVPLVGPVRLEQQRAHHRGQGQGDKPRHQHGAGQGPGKLGEQLAGGALHEADGGEHRGQGQGHGDHREGDLAAALERRLHRGHALFDMPVDVLQHDDGIVHHQTDRQDHGQQGQGIDGEAHQAH
ncbi:hypothetical protein D3C84_531210 [compost metagenome]